MMLSRNSYLLVSTISLLVLLLILGNANAFSYKPPDSIFLHDIEVLTFHMDGWTTFRRTSPVPQLQCTSGDACYDPTVQPYAVQCRNTGFDGQSVQWKCDADLNHRVKFGKMDVSCEGYHAPGDQLVLIGSCGLEYELLIVPNLPPLPLPDLTISPTPTPTVPPPPPPPKREQLPEFVWFLIFGLALLPFMGICGAALYACSSSTNQNTEEEQERQQQQPQKQHTRLSDSPPRIRKRRSRVAARPVEEEEEEDQEQDTTPLPIPVTTTAPPVIINNNTTTPVAATPPVVVEIRKESDGAWLWPLTTAAAISAAQHQHHHHYHPSPSFTTTTPPSSPTTVVVNTPAATPTTTPTRAATGFASTKTR